jgi:Mrp family chromosome partitioning ATPase
LIRAEQDLKKQIESGAGASRGPNPLYQELERRLATERANQEALDARLRALVQARQEAQRGLAVLNDADLRIRQLARDAGIAEEQVKKYAQGLDVARAESELRDEDVGNVKISQAATLPDRADSPNRKLLLMGGLFLATVAGLAAAFVSEALNTNVDTPKDLRRIGFNRIVSVPVVRLGEDGASANDDLPLPSQAIVDLAEQTAGIRGGVRQVIDTLRPTRFVRSTERPGLTVTPQRAGDDSTQPKDLLDLWTSRPEQGKAEVASNGHTNGSHGAIAAAEPVKKNGNKLRLSPRLVEACHALLERLVFGPVASGEFSKPRTLGVISITPGQGSSTLAAHLAAALTEHTSPGTEAERVLLIDANIAHPMQHRIHDVENGPGLSDWCRDLMNGDVKSMIRTTSTSQLDLLPAGGTSIGHQPGRWVDAVRAGMNATAGIVVVDLPSMAQHEAAVRAAGSCDAAVLVVESGGINREVVRQAAIRLSESGVNLIGVVLNKRTYPIPEKLYRRV